jgi:RNA polymerase sigma-70 factor (ECF subfamily)
LPAYSIFPYTFLTISKQYSFEQELYHVTFPRLPALKNNEPFLRLPVLMSRRDDNDPFLSLFKLTMAEDSSAFEALYTQTSHQLKVYLYRLVNDRSIIEDVLVETYTQVWKSSSNFSGKSKVITWIIGIARNVAFREMGKRRFHDDISDHPELESSHPDLDVGNRKEVLHRALENLSAKHREILDLAFYHELPYLDIAQLLSIPESTVKSRVFYAKAALKIMLEEMGVHKGDL